MTFQFGLGSVLCSAQINLKPGKLVHTSYKINQNRGFRQMKGDSVGDLSHTVTYFLCHTPWRSTHLDPDFCIFVLYLLRSTCKSMQFYAFGCWKVGVRISKHWHYILSHTVTIFESTCQLSRSKSCTFTKSRIERNRYSRQNGCVPRGARKDLQRRAMSCVLLKDWTYELWIPAFGFASEPETVRSCKSSIQVLGVFERVSVPLI